MKKKNILLLFPHYNSLEQNSALRSSQIGLHLEKQGYAVTVFAPGVDIRTGKLFPEIKGKLFSDIMVKGVRLIRPRCIQNFRKNFLRRFMFELFFALSVPFLFFKIKRPDVIIAAYPPAILPSIGLLMAKILHIPYIFEVRDLMADALVANNYSKSSLFNNLAVFIENTIYKKSDHIITVSKGIKKSIASKGIIEEKITPVLNGYEPQVFQNIDYSLNPRKKFGWGNKFVVIYAGGLTQSYDIQTLLSAAELSKDDKEILYVIIGEGEKKKDYIKFCADKNLENVQILDALPRKNMPALLSSANVGVHLFPDNPLWSYVLGNKPFDYLGSGIPMIYSGTGDTAELVLSAEAGFVVHPERPEKLKEKIYWLKENPEESKAMGKRGQKYVIGNYDRFVLLEKLDDVLKLILS